MIIPEDIYPITTIKYPDGETISGITYDHLEQYTAPIKYQDLVNYLAGQTMGPAGVYVEDVERWLNRLPVVD